MAEHKDFVLGVYDSFGHTDRLGTVLKGTIELYEAAGGKLDQYMTEKYGGSSFFALSDDWKIAKDLIQHPADDVELFLQCFSKVLNVKEKELFESPHLEGLKVGIRQSKILLPMLEETWQKESIAGKEKDLEENC